MCKKYEAVCSRQNIFVGETNRKAMGGKREEKRKMIERVCWKGKEEGRKDKQKVRETEGTG